MSTVLNISTLSTDVRKKDLRRLFGRVGKVGTIEIFIPEAISGYPRVALLEIVNLECARAAVLEFDERRLKRRKMFVAIASYALLLKRSWIRFEQEQ